MGRKKTYSPIEPKAVAIPQALKREIAHDSQVVWDEHTMRYGEDDALPLKIASTVDKSPATKACINTRAKFIKGAKFTSAELMKKKINKDGTTLWQFHSMLSDMLALFNGFSVNFKYNAKAKITNSYILSFESCRLLRPDDKGKIPSVRYNPYFGTSEYKVEDSIDYPVYNLETVNKEISNPQTGGFRYNGQVYYYGKQAPLHRFYPVPDYWSGEFWIKIDAGIQGFHANNLDKNFLLSIIWNAIGDPSLPSKNPKYNKKVKGEDGVIRIENPKTVGEEFNDMLTTAFAGSAKGGAGIVFWSGSENTATKAAAFPTNSNHELFTTLQNLTTKNITIATQTPGILANISEGVNLGSDGNEMRAAIELQQSRVSEEQQLLMDFYNDVLLPNLEEPTEEKVEIVNYTPITVEVTMEDKFWEALSVTEKKRWIAKNLPGIELDVVAAPAVVPPAPKTDDEGNVIPDTMQASQTNDALKSLNISDINKVQKIVARFNLWKSDPSNAKALTFDQAKQFLAGYGFTEEQINAWLVTDDEL